MSSEERRIYDIRIQAEDGHGGTCKVWATVGEVDRIIEERIRNWAAKRYLATVIDDATGQRTDRIIPVVVGDEV